MTRTLWSRHWYDGPVEIDPEGEAWRPIRCDLDVQVEPRDLWIGVYWQSYPSERELWICLVPCLVVHLWWSRRRNMFRPPKDLRATEAPARPLVEHHPWRRP